MKFTILGSCNIAELPKEFADFHNGQSLIDPRNNTPMEMNSISLYNIFTYLKCDEKKRETIDLLINRISENKSNESLFFEHNAWNRQEVHCRFISAMIRVFTYQEVKDRFSLEGIDIDVIIDSHLKYSDRLKNGTWYLHDSIEYNRELYPHKYILSDKLGSDKHNMLILNTHVDTLVTLLTINDKKYKSQIEEGLIALAYFFDCIDEPSKVFNFIDETFRNILLRCLSYNSNFFLRYIGYSVKYFYYRNIRLLIKKKKNLFNFKSGYLERDLCLAGDGVIYHLVNTWDLCKLLYLLGANEVFYSERNEKLKKLALDGVNYSLQKPYINYLTEISRSNGILNELLESIVYLFSIGFYREEFLKAYFKYRVELPPAAGLLGTDIILSDADGFERKEGFLDKYPLFSGIDVIPLRGECFFIANTSNMKINLNEIKFKFIVLPHCNLFDENYLSESEFLIIKKKSI